MSRIDPRTERVLTYKVEPCVESVKVGIVKVNTIENIILNVRRDSVNNRK